MSGFNRISRYIGEYVDKPVHKLAVSNIHMWISP